MMEIVMAVLMVLVALSCLFSLLISELRDHRQRSDVNKREAEGRHHDN
jgi:hypothetical protein